MKKVKNLILILLISLVAGVPITSVVAESIDLSKYTGKNLEEVFKEENISYDFSNYKESDEQITIYLFRGSGCAYCSKFLNYLADTLLDEYGKYFKVVSYEVWYDSSNAELMSKVANFMGDNANGVPYIIIGDKTFLGYSETMNSEIQTAITDLYNSKDRYDVFEEMQKTKTDANTSINTMAVIICSIVVVAISDFIIIYNNNKNKDALLKEIEDLKIALKKQKKVQK